MEMDSELNDIINHFSAATENYSQVYADYKMMPNNPNAETEYNKKNKTLQTLYDRMFRFKANLDKKMKDSYETLEQKTKENSIALAKKARNDSINQTINETANQMIQSPENFIETFEPAKNIDDERVQTGKRIYIIAILNIIYILIGILVISFFIYRLVKQSDSVIINDIKTKAEGIKDKVLPSNSLETTIKK